MLTERKDRKIEMKCPYCGAEMPEEANYCAKCAKPLSGIPSLDKNITAQDAPSSGSLKKDKQTKFGMLSMIFGGVSMVLSCLYAGFLGIPGIIFGIVSLKKKEHKGWKAITGIICSVLAVFVSFCMLFAEPEDSSADLVNEQRQEKENKEIKKAEQPPEKKKEEKKEKEEEKQEGKKSIQKALKDGDTESLKGNSEDEVTKIARSMLKALDFDTKDDYKTANKIAETMMSLYPEGKEIENFESIVSNYASYRKLDKTMSSDKYKGVNEKWDEASEAFIQVISDTFNVRYDVYKNSSDSTLEKIVNAITQETEEYKHAYFANGCSYNALLNMWETDYDSEYIIYTQEAFPKSGEYSLELIPTGEEMHLTDSKGFESDVPTYTIVSDADREEYSKIEKLKDDYDSLYYDREIFKENIVVLCNDFSDKQVDSEDDAFDDRSEYICYTSDMEKLSVKDVKKLSKADRRLAKNEIYARYGRKFNDESLQKYFNGKSWYDGYIEPEDFDESVFSKVEKYNIKLLAKYE